MLTTSPHYVLQKKKEAAGQQQKQRKRNRTYRRTSAAIIAATGRDKSFYDRPFTLRRHPQAYIGTKRQASGSSTHLPFTALNN